MPGENEKDTFWEFKKCLASYDVDLLGTMLKKQGVVRLSGFLPADLKQDVTGEVDRLLEFHGRRVNVSVKSTGNTPRKYVSVSRTAVFEHASLISKLYSCLELNGFLERLTEGKVVECPYESEQVVVNHMSHVGDTHGWHWDDYSYSLVLVLEVPKQQSGGRVEYVNGTAWDKSSDLVQCYLETMELQSLELESGSAYLLLGKSVMHRVSPLLLPDTRKIICFTYATEEERFALIDHGSMENIYG